MTMLFQFKQTMLMMLCSFLSTKSKLTKSVLGTLLEWSKDNVLGVNPPKTELVLITRKCKVPSFKLPCPDGITLELSKEANYLGIILDSKFFGNVMFYLCKKTFGKRCV